MEIGDEAPAPAMRPNPQLLFELASSQLDQQMAAIDAIDAKVGVLFSLGSAQAALSAAFLALNPTLMRGQGLPLLVGVAAYLAIAVISIWVLWSRSWRAGPELKDLAERYVAGADESSVRADATKGLIEAFSQNDPAITWKLRGLRAALGGVFIQTGAVLWVAAQVAVQGSPTS